MELVTRPVLYLQQQQTPESNANVTMMGHNSAAKALSFSAASLMTSTPSKFSLGSFVSTPGPPKMDCVTPSKTPWPPTESLATPGPHHSTPQRLQNSVMATPESMPISSPPDPQALNMSMDKSLTDSGKRGRPRADLITSLIQEGTSSPSGIKCSICGRVFPREKSLQVSVSVFFLIWLAGPAPSRIDGYGWGEGNTLEA